MSTFNFDDDQLMAVRIAVLDRVSMCRAELAGSPGDAHWLAALAAAESAYALLWGKA